MDDWQELFRTLGNLGQTLMLIYIMVQVSKINGSK